jgi:hypothetical protein
MPKVITRLAATGGGILPQAQRELTDPGLAVFARNDMMRGGHVVTCRICDQSRVVPKTAHTDGAHTLCLLAEACPELVGDMR